MPRDAFAVLFFVSVGMLVNPLLFAAVDRFASWMRERERQAAPHRFEVKDAVAPAAAEPSPELVPTTLSGGYSVAPSAAGRRPNNPLSGPQKSSASAITISVETRPFEKNTRRFRPSRGAPANASSALSPSTSASTRGASG